MSTKKEKCSVPYENHVWDSEELNPHCHICGLLMRDDSVQSESIKNSPFVDGQYKEGALIINPRDKKFLEDNGVDTSGMNITKDIATCSSESIEWEESLSEYGQLHSEDCCVNFPEDSRACDVDTGVVDCCENMRVIANFVTAEKEKSRKEENDRWVEMAEAHRPHCSATGNKMLTSMMGKKNRISKAITTAVAKREESYREEILDKLRNATCYSDPSRGVLLSNPPQHRCDACGKLWYVGDKAPVCEYIRKADITNLKH